MPKFIEESKPIIIKLGLVSDHSDQSIIIFIPIPNTSRGIYKCEVIQW